MLETIIKITTSFERERLGAVFFPNIVNAMSIMLKLIKKSLKYFC